MVPYSYIPDANATTITPRSVWADVMRGKGLNLGVVLELNQRYGGPHALAQYKAFIEIPYQYSTMKVSAF